MTPQAITILVVYIIILIIALIGSITSKTFNVWSALGFVIYFLFIALVAYDTNCLTVGDCGVWSWIRTVFYILAPVISIITLIFGLAVGTAAAKKAVKQEKKH
jgi:hypothetical protein